MSDKEKKKRRTEIEQPDTREVDHHTPHPKPDQIKDIQDTNFAPGENSYLNQQNEL